MTPISFWQDRYARLSEAMRRAHTEPVLNKVTEFIGDPAIRHILGQTHSTVDFAAAMQQGRWVVVNLAKGVLGERAYLLGNLLMAYLQGEVMARARIPKAERRVCALILDEVQNLKENDVVTFLTECRKFAVSVTTSNQYWDQLQPHFRGALLATGTQMFFRLSSADAGVLGPELSTAHRSRYVAELTALRQGEAVVRIGSEPPARIRVPPLPRLTDADRKRAGELASLSRLRFMRLRSDIEAAISERQRSLHTEHESQTSHETAPTSTNEGQTGW